MWVPEIDCMKYVEFLDLVLAACSEVPPWPPEELRPLNKVGGEGTGWTSRAASPPFPPPLPFWPGQLRPLDKAG